MGTLSVRSQTLAVLGLFFVNGTMIGIWGGSLPSMRDRVGTDARGIAILLVITGVAAVLSMQIGGRLGDRMGAKVPTFIAAAVMVVAMGALSWAPTFTMLAVAGVIMGLGNGTMDVTMNSLGVDVEKLRTTPIMSRFHGFFSIGSFTGAALILLVSRIAGHPVSWLPPLLVAALAVVLLVALWRVTPRGSTHADLEADHPSAGGKVPTAAWLLGIMALCFGFTEGTGVDWASIHVTDVANVDPGTGALGLVAVSATMVLIRLFGDHAVNRFGRARVVQFGSVTSSLGYLVVAFFSSLPVIVAGWLLVGLGVGMIAPQIYALAGYLGGGRVLAIVTAFGYTAFLAGPALIGFVADYTGLQRAMLVPLASALGLIVMSFFMPREPESSPTAPESGLRTA